MDCIAQDAGKQGFQVYHGFTVNADASTTYGRLSADDAACYTPRSPPAQLRRVGFSALSQSQLQRPESTPSGAEQSGGAALTVVGSSECSGAVQRMVAAVQAGMSCQQQPDAASEGLGGTYFMKDDTGRSVAILKPCDEEPLAPNNPKGFKTERKKMGQPGLKPTVRIGEAAFREVAAYLLDHGHFSRVPATVLVRAHHPVLHTPNVSDILDWDPVGPSDGGSAVDCCAAAAGGQVMKLASLQEFVPHKCDTNEMGPSRFSTRDVHHIGILDIRMMNTDRHAGNMLVCSRRVSTGNLSALARLDEQQYNLIPIDHGFCLPEALEPPYFEWLHWPQAMMPFDADELEYIASLDPLADIELLRRQLPMLRVECLRVLHVSTLLLQKCAAAGLSLSEIGTVMSRSFVGVEDEPSEFERVCEAAMNAAAATCAAACDDDDDFADADDADIDDDDDDEDDVSDGEVGTGSDDIIPTGDCSSDAFGEDLVGGPTIGSVLDCAEGCRSSSHGRGSGLSVHSSQHSTGHQRSRLSQVELNKDLSWDDDDFVFDTPAEAPPCVPTAVSVVQGGEPLVLDANMTVSEASSPNIPAMRALSEVDGLMSGLKLGSGPLTPVTPLRSASLAPSVNTVPEDQEMMFNMEEEALQAKHKSMSVASMLAAAEHMVPDHAVIMSHAKLLSPDVTRCCAATPMIAAKHGVAFAFPRASPMSPFEAAFESSPEPSSGAESPCVRRGDSSATDFSAVAAMSSVQSQSSIASSAAPRSPLYHETSMPVGSMPIPCTKLRPALSLANPNGLHYKSKPGNNRPDGTIRRNHRLRHKVRRAVRYPPAVTASATTSTIFSSELVGEEQWNEFLKELSVAIDGALSSGRWRQTRTPGGIAMSAPHF